MSNAGQRTEWAAHLKDEAQAIAQQQVAAGQTHEPQAGPLPYSQNDVATAVHQAVLAERTRCARVAASFVDDALLMRLMPATSRELRTAAAAMARRIADVLREPAG